MTCHFPFKKSTREDSESHPGWYFFFLCSKYPFCGKVLTIKCTQPIWVRVCVHVCAYTYFSKTTTNFHLSFAPSTPPSSPIIKHLQLLLPQCLLRWALSLGLDPLRGSDNKRHTKCSQHASVLADSIIQAIGAKDELDTRDRTVGHGNGTKAPLHLNLIRTLQRFMPETDPLCNRRQIRH